MKSKIFILTIACFTLGLILFSYCKKNKLSDTPYTPNGPTIGRIGYLYTFSSSFSDLNVDSFAARFSWDDGDTSDWSLYVPSGDTVMMSHSWSNTGTYYVKAQAKDTKEKISNWSLGVEIVISANNPPDIPSSPIGPDSGNGNCPYAFSCSTTDPDGDSIAIRFSWGDEDTSEWSSFVSSGESISMSHSYSSSNIFFVKAQAKDRLGAISNWSDEHQIFISNIGLIKWQYNDCGSVWSSPAIGPDRTIYFGSDDNRLYALNPDGSLKWRYSTNGNIVSSPAIGSDGTIYVGSAGGRFYAVNPDGSEKWKYLADDEISSSPAIGLDGTVYFGTSWDGYLYALNPDGSLKWRYLTPGQVNVHSPAINSTGIIYCGADSSNASYLFALDPNGNLNWQYRITPLGISSPAIDLDGTIYLGVGRYCYAINPDSTLKWQYQLGSDLYQNCSPVIGQDGTIYFVPWDTDCKGSHIYALNPDGSLKWSLLIETHVYSSPVLGSDGIIYVGNWGEGPSTTFFYAIDTNVNPADPSIFKWVCPLDCGTISSPIIGSDGSVYFGTEDGFYAIQGSGTLANSPWPNFRHDLRNTGRVGGP